MKMNDVKVGSIHVGSTVKIVWGKSKKTYEATILEDLDNSSPAIPPQRQRRQHRSDELLIEVGSPTPLAPGPELSTPLLIQHESLETQKILQKMEELQDFVSQ